MKPLKSFNEFLAESKNLVFEARIEDPEIIDQIEEFHRLQMEIKRAENELEEKKRRFKEFDSKIQPIIEGMKSLNDKLAETDTHIIKITRFGYERESSSYKDAFELALTKVNAATKKILNEALQSSTKISKISASYSIDVKVEEANILSQISTMIKNAVSSFFNLFRKEEKVIDEANEQLSRLSKK